MISHFPLPHNLFTKQLIRPNKPMITNFGVDSLNRIWVQRSFEQYPTFDLYDTSDEHLMTAVLPGRSDTDHLTCTCNRCTIVL